MSCWAVGDEARRFYRQSRAREKHLPGLLILRSPRGWLSQFPSQPTCLGVAHFIPSQPPPAPASPGLRGGHLPQSAALTQGRGADRITDKDSSKRGKPGSEAKGSGEDGLRKHVRSGRGREGMRAAQGRAWVSPACEQCQREDDAQ